MKKVLLFGAVGYNLGDEAIALALREDFKKYQIDLQFSAMTDLLLPKDNYFIFNRKNPLDWLKTAWRILQAEAVLVGGGTVIQDKLGISKFRGMLPYICQVAFLARLLGKKVYTVPIGADKLNTDMGRDYAAYFLKSLSYAAFRDTESLAYARQLAPDIQAQSTEFADPAYILEADSSYKKYQDQKYICISLVNEGIDFSNKLPGIIQFMQWILEHTNQNIVLICMDIRDMDEYALYQEIIKNFTNSNRIFIERDINSQQAATILRKADFLLAARLHAMILGVSYVPMMIFSRSDKTKNFARIFNHKTFDLHNGVSFEEIMVEYQQVAQFNAQPLRKILAEEQNKVYGYTKFKKDKVIPK